VRFQQTAKLDGNRQIPRHPASSSALVPWFSCPVNTTASGSFFSTVACLSARLPMLERAAQRWRASLVRIVLHGQPHNGYIWAARIMIEAKLTAAHSGGSVRVAPHKD
jgi:hypothetical protein